MDSGEREKNPVALLLSNLGKKTKSMCSSYNVFLCETKISKQFLLLNYFGVTLLRTIFCLNAPKIRAITTLENEKMLRNSFFFPQ